MGSTTQRPKILLLGSIDFAKSTWNDLSDIADLIEPKSTNRSDFIKECRTDHLTGVVAAYRTFASGSITGKWDEELIDALPKSLQFCINNGAGYDAIDVHACADRQPPIKVANVPTIVDDATADTAVFLILGALRGFNTSMLSLRNGEWRGKQPPPLGHDPEGKVLGILGMGGIGRNMMKKCAGFGMKTIYHNRKKLSEEMAGGAKYVEFEELLAQSDVLSLNLPLNPKTRHIISTEQFKKMKKGIIIVNTARGAVMDEAALVEALESGQVASVGLDVYEEEPKIHPGLVDNPHVMLLPHMGTWTLETMTAMEEFSIGNVRSAVETGKLKSPVPEHADL
ncbi:glyoxylate reductase [Recurvomyces mirabilis]|uniref:Glyoxylate reductase n=1 Tax=Recurvomyces mirabilis TaxID=574656 RepID=A0AAE0WI50_9PEZI|nr:glyoxylate reductase [Recurvomyces mirabilis]KAK5160030.1 glyoxylate reductase [Recurvomyces mirabilis]